MPSLIQTGLAGYGDTCMPETNAGGLGVWGSLSYQARLWEGSWEDQGKG